MKEGPTIIAILAIAFLCCCCLFFFTTIAFSFIIIPLESSDALPIPPLPNPGTETPTPVVIRPSPPTAGNTATPIPTGTTETLLLSTPEIEPTHESTEPPSPTPSGNNFPFPVPTDTLVTLQNAIVPLNDLLDLARRLEGKVEIPLTLDPPPAPFQVGAQQTFWASDADTNENFQVNAILRYVTDHLYFWIEEGLRYSEEDLRDLAETFESEIYPTTREFFGSEWTPGVDGDPHIYILFAGGLGSNLAGYFSPADEYHPLAHENSNAHEMFFINADNQRLNREYTYGVLAHEFQHMIHWYQDRNETTWLNEGFSELAVVLNGYDVGGFDYDYTTNPDLQLNHWPNRSAATTPHYGASFLFTTYFLDRFGAETTKALVAHPEDGISSVDTVLASIEAKDPLTGEAIRADQVFLDWVIATYLQDESVSDGRFTYHNYPEAPRPSETETFRVCPLNPVTRDVHQYGVDYIRFVCKGDYTLHFEGSVQVDLLPTDPYSGSYAFWSNIGDASDMTLTRYFDFTDRSGPLTLAYRTWYDLEKDYDYLYLVASSDGETWQILTTPSGTPEDPSGNSYGWGYNGLSGGRTSAQWIQETVDISQFAGEIVFLRFEYLTDAAAYGEGFLLDNIAIPEIGYFEDFENDDGGWEAAGWARIQNVLPQTFRLALISFGDTTTVEYIQMKPDMTADIPLQIGDDVDQVVLVVTGTTRFTRQKAAYRFEVGP